MAEFFDKKGVVRRWKSWGVLSTSVALGLVLVSGVFWPPRAQADCVELIVCLDEKDPRTCRKLPFCEFSAIELWPVCLTCPPDIAERWFIWQETFRDVVSQLGRAGEFTRSDAYQLQQELNALQYTLDELIQAWDMKQ